MIKTEAAKGFIYFIDNVLYLALIISIIIILS